MRLRNQELMEEFYSRHSNDYPGLTIEQCTAICHTPFKFLRNCIEGDEITEIRLKYFGSFQVYPGRAKNILYNIKERLNTETISQKQFDKQSNMINKHLTKLEND